jgi:hypothetical protein
MDRTLSAKSSTKFGTAELRETRMGADPQRLYGSMRRAAGAACISAFALFLAGPVMAQVTNGSDEDKVSIVEGPGGATTDDSVSGNSAGMFGQGANRVGHFHEFAKAIAGDIDITNTKVKGATYGRSIAEAIATINLDRTQTTTNSVVCSPMSSVCDENSPHQNGEQTTNVEDKAIAFSFAKSGVVVIRSSGPVQTGKDGVEALSSASAGTLVGSQVTQGNTNFLGVRQANVPRQDLRQENTIEQHFFAVSVAIADDVSVTRNGSTSARDGVNAASYASAAADVGSGIKNTQSNSNGFNAASTRGPINQTQGFNGPVVPPLTQVNEINQISAALSLAAAGDVAVSVNGQTEAGRDGINARSDANATANTASAADQSNDNSASLNSSAPTLSNGVQRQLIDQDNINGGLLAAASAAFSGEVRVTSRQDTAAGRDGVSAQSIATAAATVSSRVRQANTNSLAAESAARVGGSIEQTQNVEQENANGAEDDKIAVLLEAPIAEKSERLDGALKRLNEKLDGDEVLVAASLAVSDDATVERIGNTDAKNIGINAASVATADATVDSLVDQSNTNSATAGTNGLGASISQYQGVSQPCAVGATCTDQINSKSRGVDQINLNQQKIAALSIASADDVWVSNRGNVNSGGSGIKARSIAGSWATIDSTVDQENSNSLGALTTGEPYHDVNAEISQKQQVGQENRNEQGMLAAAIAETGDVTALNTGNIGAGWNSIFAESKAEAGSSIKTTVNQANRNGPFIPDVIPDEEAPEVEALTAETQGNFASISQRQSVGQQNRNPIPGKRCPKVLQCML